MASRGGTTAARKERKKQRKKDIEKSKQPGERPYKEFGAVSGKDPAREELRKKQIEEGGEFAKDVAEKAREREIQNIAQKSVDIEKRKDVLREEEKPQQEELPIGADAGVQKVREQGKEDIEYETIIQEDVYGTQREIQMPIGTSGKINAGLQARMEGRMPFDELPVYQQFLVGAAVTGTSPGIIAKGGKYFNSAAKEFGKFVKTNLGKYIIGVVGIAPIITWLASDNIISSMSIYTRDLVDDVTFGHLSAEAAIEKIKPAEEFIELARNFIRGATIISPFLWPFRNIILTHADAAQLGVDENKNRIIRGG